MNIKGLIGESQAVEQPVHSHFICSICFDVANDPKKCSDCEHLYCLECSVKVTACPQCCVEKMISVPLCSFEQDDLNKMEFECFKCTQNFLYKDKELHSQRCDSVRGVCPADCGKKGVQNVKHLNEHFETCQRVVQSCTCCEAPLILQSDDYICRKKLYNTKE